MRYSCESTKLYWFCRSLSFFSVSSIKIFSVENKKQLDFQFLIVPKWTIEMQFLRNEVNIDRFLKKRMHALYFHLIHYEFNGNFPPNQCNICVFYFETWQSEPSVHVLTNEFCVCCDFSPMRKCVSIEMRSTFI